LKKLKEKGLGKNKPKQKLKSFILKKNLCPSLFKKILSDFAT